MGIFVNLFTNFGFKKLFGKGGNKPFLISFLNELIGLEDPIIDIKYLNIDKLGIEVNYYITLFVLNCTTKSNAHVLVELQNPLEDFYVDRSVFHSSFLIQKPSRVRKLFSDTPKIYSIAILDFNLDIFDNDPNFIHVLELTGPQTKSVFYEKLTYIYLETKKLKKEIDLNAFQNLEELKMNVSMLELWVYIYKNLHRFEKGPRILRGTIF